MNRFLEFNYIAPMTKINFDTVNNKYYIIIINASNNDELIYKIDINDIGNISADIRAYSINKLIKITLTFVI